MPFLYNSLVTKVPNFTLIWPFLLFKASIALFIYRYTFPYRRGIIRYILQSIRVSVPSSELAATAPSPPNECVPTSRNQRVGVNTRLPLRGRSQIGRQERAWYSVYSVIISYACLHLYRISLLCLLASFKKKKNTSIRWPVAQLGDIFVRNHKR